MAKDERVGLPTGFGGLTRFKEEYNSKIKLKPTAVIGFIIGIIALVVLLRIFYPIAA
jgi:preprotein translocase subunit Sec61beta